MIILNNNKIIVITMNLLLHLYSIDLIFYYYIIVIRHRGHFCYNNTWHSIEIISRLIYFCKKKPYMQIIIINPEWHYMAAKTLAQIMASCQTAPSHFLKLNQCWLKIIGTPVIFSQKMHSICCQILSFWINFSKIFMYLPGKNELKLECTKTTAKKNWSKWQLD